MHMCVCVLVGNIHVLIWSDYLKVYSKISNGKDQQGHDKESDKQGKA